MIANTPADGPDGSGLMSSEAIKECLESRLGRIHARQRMGIEKDHEAQVFGQGLTFFHFENLPWSHAITNAVLRLTGAYWRGRANAARVELRINEIVSSRIPAAFDGYEILHLTDLHADMSGRALESVAELVSGLEYDLCVLTGDYRAQTFGPWQPSLRMIEKLRKSLKGSLFGVLGNHDSIMMAPDLERMGIRMLLNESVEIAHRGASISLAGVDDAHFYRVDNVEKAASEMPHDRYSILLSHTPEIYRQAAHAGFDLMLSGHTHGGQICLPGGHPVTLESKLPRSFGRGAWRYGEMSGYTSAGAGTCIAQVRFNCPPEITIHRLRHGADQ